MQSVLTLFFGWRALFFLLLFFFLIPVDYKHLLAVTDRWHRPCCFSRASFTVCKQLWVLFKQTPSGRNWKWKAPWSTAASPYAGKWVSSRDSWLCQVWQKWPVFSLWLLLMLNYINYECGSQRAWGGRSISVSLLKAVPLIIHHRPRSTEPQIPSHVCRARWHVRVCVFAGMHPPGPPLARPVLPRERGAMDRVIEYLVGDGPQNRWMVYCKIMIYIFTLSKIKVWYDFRKRKITI